MIYGKKNFLFYEKIFVARKQVNRKNTKLKNTIVIYKKKKSVKQSKIIAYQPKSFENPKNVDIKSIITEHPKTSHKLCKTIR